MSKELKKKWKIKYDASDDSYISEMSCELGISKVLSSLIWNRGYRSVKEASSFLKKNQEILHNPFLLNDMEKAVERIIKAINSKEKITVYGDYDVDGVTSVSILCLYLKKHGANVDYYIPSRKGEGYGVSIEAVKKLSQEGTTLIITVDTGITAIEEARAAKELGIEMVITDHHECTGVLPDAVAVINPKRHDSTYPFSNLAGVGVAFKLLCAIQQKISNSSIIDATREVAYGYSDLTAIGTIADVMPVIDENRILISLGLSQAEKTDKIGLASLISYCRSGDGKSPSKYKQKKKLSSGFVGFTLAPRINAAGRISSASIAVELFLCESSFKADELALQLCEINRERQATENKIADEAYEIIETKGYDKNSMIVLDNCDWHHGVIGIVSSRVSDRYGVPSILISFEGNDDPMDMEAVGKGSGRSVHGMNLVDALSSCSDLLEKYGGHELAAGLSIKRKNLPKFIARMEEYAKKCFDGSDPEMNLEIDCELEPSMLTLKLAEEISALEPYGVSNPTPVFALRNMVISDIIPVGMNRHLKLTLVKDTYIFNAMLFSTSPQEFTLNENDEVDLAFTLDINEFNGASNLQICVKDIQPSQRFCHFEKVNEELFEGIKNGECQLDSSSVVPERNDFTLVYSFLLNSARLGKSCYRIAKLLSDIIEANPNCLLNYVKLKFVIMVFRELNIITIEMINEVTFSFHFSFSKGKTSLDKSNILKKLKTMYPK